MVLYFHNRFREVKGQENKIYTIVKVKETFYCSHTVPITNFREVKYDVLKVTLGSNEYTKELKEYRVQVFWARLAGFCHLGIISDPLIISKFHSGFHDPKGQENKINTIYSEGHIPPKHSPGISCLVCVCGIF